MPIVNRVAALSDEVAIWRRDLHAHPELDYDVHRTAGVVAQKLREFGCDEVVPGIGRTGVVGVIHGRSTASGRAIGMRADMDALPIDEAVDRPWKSTHPGKMHACGHDGHTAMLLGAAKYLAETRNFDGTAIVIFQPAEEGGAGGKAMVDDGMMERFGVTEVYGMHNMPGLPVGAFAIRPGAMLAAADRFIVDIEGKGAHAAKPHEGIDTVLVASHVVTALQSIVSRNADPLESAVVSVTSFHGGSAFNIIPQTVQLKGTVRTLKPDMQDAVEKRFSEIVHGVCAAFGAKASVDYWRGYPVTFNHTEQTAFAVGVAREVAGAGNVVADAPPTMGGEDFSFMLNARPGAFIFVGNGATAGLHHPAYDFDDAVIPVGVSYWARLAETAMPA